MENGAILAIANKAAVLDKEFESALVAKVKRLLVFVGTAPVAKDPAMLEKVVGGRAAAAVNRIDPEPVLSVPTVAAFRGSAPGSPADVDQGAVPLRRVRLELPDGFPVVREHDLHGAPGGPLGPRRECHRCREPESGEHGRRPAGYSAASILFSTSFSSREIREPIPSTPPAASATLRARSTMSRRTVSRCSLSRTSRNSLA